MPLSPKRLDALKNQDDEKIDYGDIPELDEAFFRHAKLVAPDLKQQITLRLDGEVLAWFRAQGKGYQTRMNAVLKAYMLSQKT